ncbi:succinylglutamate desuccinylase/aspartoacylase family protein [Portibacter marinus]|uniref:succinylglutamate desuccinylase/aspartoacylase family protein n=1 Tax=Portibacter marinus TaxID=2898660 RepID=UPI001F1E0623|nr:succinylglutamate desuccinylase/aspartoacylase family protein [Portibacter marinus]
MIHSHIKKIDLDILGKGKIYHFWFDLVSGPFGEYISLPLIIAKGVEPGPTLGLTAAIHGNELNGIPVIHKVLKNIDPKALKGNIIAIPVVNIPSFQRKKRRFIDGTDLNHIMPGKKNGNVSQVYAYRFTELILPHFDYLVDLHTASFGRVNSYYVRADMKQDTTRKMALFQGPQIIVHNPPSDGTLRGVAAERNIPAITVEAGNPNTFQRGMIKDGSEGIMNIAIDLGMISGNIIEEDVEPIICNSSYWIYTEHGGLLTVYPRLVDRVMKNDLIAKQHNIFGDTKQEYHAPEDGVIIGKSVSPVNQTGGRILHLGIPAQT